MPSPLEILFNPISLIILGFFAALMIWEAVWPARQLPQIKYWKVRALIVFAAFFFLSSYLPIWIDPFLAQYQLMDLSHLGVLPGATLGILVFELVLFGWHWAIHKSNFLWRVFHQMHHSVERIDSYGAFYFSPMDMIGFTLVGSVSLALIMGISPQAVTVTILATNFMAIFQHANVKTPYWLGYLIQRPEGHALHHAKGIHKYNYCDLSFIDMIFGTFKNPKTHDIEAGFYHGASARIKDMILFRDINRPAA